MTQADPNTTPVRTRREAHGLGLKKYWTGKPCARGHNSMRYVCSGLCSACVSGYQRDYNKRFKKGVEANDEGKAVLTVTTYPELREAIAAHAAALEMALEWECPPGVPMVEWLKSRKN